MTESMELPVLDKMYMFSKIGNYLCATIFGLAVNCSFLFSPSFQTMNPAAPIWHPKKMVPAKGHVHLQPHYSFRPRSRDPNVLRHNLWVPPGYKGGPGYWNTNQNLAYCYS